jgi:hypothetical protein
MLATRLALFALVALIVAPGATPAVKPPKLIAPAGLRAFLLRSDELPGHEFPRTPSFAWTPVKGAQHYEFTLSTSPLSAGSGLVWDDSTLTSPAAAVRIALPWITGNPYSLYARVRAIAVNGSVGPWTQPYGFNVRWPNVPVPLASPQGLIRWTPVEGATSYQVWYVNSDIGGRSKIFSTTTNVADEREYYAFHQTDDFIKNVRWRIRAVRAMYGGSANGLPAVSYGPWSNVYETLNPQLTVLTGNPRGILTPTGTISDVASTPLAPTTHGLMPAFTFSGNQNNDLSVSPLFRVYVFTDRDCVNLVYKSAIVGGPAYAPRSSGPLALPRDQAGLDAARNTFLPDGAEGTSFTTDGLPITATESDKPSVFTVKTGTVTSSSGTGSATPAAADPNAFPTTLTGSGAPTDLWDTGWPTGEYYWTVVGVTPVTRTAVLVGGAPAGSDTITVSSSAGFAVTDRIRIGTAANVEVLAIAKIDGATITLNGPLARAHAAGEPVTKASGTVEYFDQDVAQDACTSGRIASFGKTSPTALSAGAAPFASGLSPSGRLVSAAGSTPKFYGPPLVAWQPALGATAYELQLSKSKYPWRAIGNPYYTFSTAATLPLTPGTWYYRVRGINLSLPAGAAQQMSWSNPIGLVVTKPKFKIVKTK